MSTIEAMQRQLLGLIGRAVVKASVPPRNVRPWMCP